MDKYFGGTSTNYITNDVMLNRGIELLSMLKEDMNHIGAEDPHQLQRTWELHHRLLASESVTQQTLFRKEKRWPGHCFTLSRYDGETGKWGMEKAPVCHIIDGCLT